jgi:hypothetical protein
MWLQRIAVNILSHLAIVQAYQEPALLPSLFPLMNTCPCSRKCKFFLILVNATDLSMPKTLEMVSHLGIAWMIRILLKTMSPSRAQVALMFQHFDDLSECLLGFGLKNTSY